MKVFLIKLFTFRYLCNGRKIQSVKNFLLARRLKIPERYELRL